MFVHLHVHSNFSFCRGADRLESIVVAARQRGYGSLALTDTNGLYGLVWFLGAARTAGLRPIVGAEVVYGAERAVVLVKDREGYAGLCRLLTRVHRALNAPVSNGAGRVGACEAAGGPDAVDGTGSPDAWQDESLPLVEITSRPARRKPDPGFSLGGPLAELPGGVVILSPCAGLLERLARERGLGDARGAPGLYAELRPGGPPGLRSLVRRSGVPAVATGAVHFVDPSGRARHHLLRAIALNTTLDRVPAEELAPPSCSLAPPAEMERRFPDLPGALEASARIAEECRFVPEMGRPIFPVYEAPDGRRLGDREAADYLESECREGIVRRYGRMTPEAERRLRHEMGIIREKGFAAYFLVVRDIVRQAPRTCGRGSAAASLVSYSLGITHVDPIRYDLFFERFLNPGRVDPPDIDVDFPWDERDRLLEWVFARYGRRRTAMIANHNSFQARAAVREIAKVQGIPDAEIGRITKRFPWYASDDPAELVRTHPIFKDARLSEPWPSILDAARELDGFPRNLSVHCGGVVLVPDAIERHVPVQPAAKGVDVIQWEKDQAEEYGLVKMDLLGNRSLAVIRDACAAVSRNGGPEIAFERFQPLGDEAAQRLIARGDTVGVFYVESPAMRQLQARCGTGSFERLVVHSSIIRPAANDYIREYVRRLRGGSYRSLHPIMDEIMAESFGIMVYQEDVAKMVIAMAGFDAASADDLRKVLSRKHKERRLADDRERFFRGAAERGFERETVEKVWEMILSFGGYSFCKPHSASYALVSFKSAWLRAHYPAEFMAAVISNGGGYYSTFAYISEARRMGLDVLLPDVNESEKHYTGRTFRPADSVAGPAAVLLPQGTLAVARRACCAPPSSLRGRWSVAPPCSPAAPLLVKGPPGATQPPALALETAPGGLLQPSAALSRGPNAPLSNGPLESEGATGPPVRDAVGVIRVGLQQLQGFPAVATDALLEERRRGGPFRSLEDFLDRLGEDLGPAAVKVLVRAGGFDGPGGAAAVRPLLMWRLAAWSRARERMRSRSRLLWEPEEAAGPPANLEPYEPRHVLGQEVEALGFLISRHPLTLFEEEIGVLARAGRPPLVRGRELREGAVEKGARVRLVGWFVTAKTVHTKKGEPMEFLSFEDTTALYETTFFPRTYARFCHMMARDRPYVLEGKVDEDLGVFTLNVARVASLGAPSARPASPGRRI